MADIRSIGLSYNRTRNTRLDSASPFPISQPDYQSIPLPPHRESEKKQVVGGGRFSCSLEESEKKEDGHGYAKNYIWFLAMMIYLYLWNGSVKHNASYVYHALFAYFDRYNVALRGLARFFRESSREGREHGEKLMEYQNKCGGKVKLQSILMPLSEFDHTEKGDALYAMELALSLEKLTYEKLLNLYSLAEKKHDVQLADFIESQFLSEQVEAIKKISEYVAQLRRVGKGRDASERGRWGGCIMMKASCVCSIVTIFQGVLCHALRG